MSTDSKNLQHLSLGSLTRALKVPSTSELKHYGKMGLGVVVGNTVPKMALARIPLPVAVPAIAIPFIESAIGIIGGGIVSKKVDRDVGTGIIAGAAAIGVGALVGMVMARVAPAVAQDGQANIEGLAGMRSLASGSLYGVGTPDVGAARMFAGATVAMEEVGGPMAGATVQFEPSSNFAGVLN